MIEILIKLEKQFPNDSDLGRAIRSLVSTYSSVENELTNIIDHSTIDKKDKKK